MNDTQDLLSLSATALASLIRNKDISPVELVEASIARIEMVNPILNAVVTENFAAARHKAKHAEKAVLDGD